MDNEIKKRARSLEKKFAALLTPSLPKEFILKSAADSTIDARLVSYFYPHSAASEQYRRLRENIKKIGKTRQIQTLAITSAVPGEGKSITAVNLAISLAKDVDCPRVLVIDADLRRGTLDKRVGINGKVGLSEYLSIGAEKDNIIYKTMIDKLSIIPRGKMIENPAELLASNKMVGLLNELKREFAYIIIDTTPLIAATDAAILCGIADSSLIVIRSGKTRRGLVDHAREILEQAHGSLIGFVLTQVEYHVPEYIYKYV